MVNPNCRAKNPAQCPHHSNLDRALAVLVPRLLNNEYAEYFKATDGKHFGDSTVSGSKFTSPGLNSIEDIVKLRVAQKGGTLNGLKGNDIDELIKLGSDHDAFGEGFRYLKVDVEGTVGIISSEELSSDTKLFVTQTKPTAPYSLVVEVNKQPVTNFGVLILGQNEITQEEYVITTFPGPVVKPRQVDVFAEYAGQVLTVSEAKNILNTNRFWVETVKVED